MSSLLQFVYTSTELHIAINGKFSTAKVRWENVMKSTMVAGLHLIFIFLNIEKKAHYLR